jgi:Putative adhesin
MSAIRIARRFAALTALSLLATAIPAPLLAQDDDDRPTRREEFKWSGQIAPGQTVEVKGVNGPIHAEPSTSGQVEVYAIKSGRRSDPRGVTIKVVPHAEGVTICSVYPNVEDEPNECLPGRRGRMNTRNNDVKVEFTVRVPSGANLAARTVNGGIDARDLDGRVEVSTVNGSVDFSTQGTGVAKTVNGSINGKLGRADWTDTLELETVNGSITLALPAGTDADVDARTVNGRINSSLPLTLQEMTRRSLKGTLGSGGRGLSLGTVNGSITLKSGE